MLSDWMLNFVVNLPLNLPTAVMWISAVPSGLRARNGDLEINSQVSREGGSLVYSVDGHAYVKVKWGEEGEEMFRMRIDNIIMSLVEEWKESKHTREISKLIELRQEIGASRDLIDIQLVKYLRKPVFGGDCEYLK